jgi:hypothetical protein
VKGRLAQGVKGWGRQRGCEGGAGTECEGVGQAVVYRNPLITLNSEVEGTIHL